jgi:hypothetical protein
MSDSHNDSVVVVRRHTVLVGFPSALGLHACEDFLPRRSPLLCSNYWYAAFLTRTIGRLTNNVSSFSDLCCQHGRCKIRTGKELMFCSLIVS